MNDTPLFRIRGLGKTFSGPGEELSILSDVNLDVRSGESLAIVGASGSGKTTLLHIMGTLDKPSRGEVFFEERDLTRLGTDEASRFRNREIGFVYQFHHLLPEFDTQENVAMPAIIGGAPRSRALAMAREALLEVGLEERARHKVTTLSGGERQRAAIARAILQKPRALLADEPTGSLDEANGRRISELMLRLNRDMRMTLVVVTHNKALAGLMDRRLELSGGMLHEV